MSFKFVHELIASESHKIITHEGRVVSQFVSRGLYSAVAITQSVITASDLTWKPYGWDSLFEGLIPDFRELPITGISCDNAEAFCHAVGGTLCDDVTALALCENLWESLSRERRNHYSVVVKNCLNQANRDGLLAGRYAARTEFYLLKAAKEHDVDIKDLCRLPLLVDEMTMNTRLEEPEESCRQDYILNRAEFHAAKPTFTRINISPESVHDAGFRCIWKRADYEHFLESWQETAR